MSESNDKSSKGERRSWVGTLSNSSKNTSVARGESSNSSSSSLSRSPESLERKVCIVGTSLN